MRSNRVDAKTYPFIPSTSHTRALPIHTREFIQYQAKRVNEEVRCWSKPLKEGNCPNHTPRMSDTYSAYSNMVQRDINKQLGLVMRDVSRNGQFFESPVTHIPKHPIVIHKECLERDHKTPEGFSRVLQTSTIQCRLGCRTKPMCDWSEVSSLSGRLLY
ncbi:unnamed protein product [Mesocestoides corti]|uniref:C1orf105 n=1 Tax=Mesocestoides corti TaxID=53468 RepID=A0A0R3UF14_MESCO|nr:unnamed protein product [Mesocestoides corti]